MSNVVKLKRSAVASKVPSTADLQLGELALNTYDGNLFFKKDPGTASIVTVATLNGTQTLSNKTLSSPTISGTITIGGSTGTSGQVLVSTGTGVQWQTKDVTTLDSLTDVVITNPQANQLLTYTGSSWVNADPNTVVTSTVFSGANYDMGFVYDAILDISEDLAFIEDPLDISYDLGPLSISGVVSLSNLDQSVKADYIGYSIIFGF